MASTEEFRGKGGVVRVEGNELVITRKGLGTGLAGTNVPRRIPIAAIRDVLFKEPGKAMKLGYIHFVLGDTPTPVKTSWWALADHPESVDFDGKKEAREFRRLYEWTQRWIEQTRAAGVDPATVKVLTVEENVGRARQQESAELDDKLFAGKIVGRSELGVGAPNEAFIARLRERPDLLQLHSLDALPGHLQSNERLELLAAGQTLLALTDRRVLAVGDEKWSSRYEEAARSEITSVSMSSSLLHGVAVTFHVGARQIKVAGLNQEMVNRFIQAIEPAKQTLPLPPPPPPTPPTAPDVMDQLRQLGELRDAGVLTEDEFSAKKAELLGRI
ncbi:SHOCT domain-containing protein [Pimelobacter simplex]|uniref:SHOCT domain-containing protein n=1 Tax=Nocardioides simplex TaxID=2045 RepID=UPI003AABAE74